MIKAIAMSWLLQWAADPPAELGKLQVTAGRAEQSTFEAAGAVSVVDREAIAVEIPKIAVDALRGIPGVFVQQTTPGQGIPIVRGLKGSEVLHLVDGVRLNNSFFRNAPNQYIALVDAGIIDRIEVLRGPASSLYGADAMGGVVQFITRRPAYGERRTALNVFGASADHTLGASASHESGGDSAAWRVQASVLDVGDRETGDGREISPSGYRARALNSMLRWRADDRREWLLDVQHLEQPSTPRVDELIAGFGQTQPDSAEFFFEPNQRTFAHLRRIAEADTAWFQRFELHASWQRLVDDRRSRGFGSSQRRLESNDSNQWGLSGQFDLDWGRRSQLLYGFEIYRDEVSSARRAVDLESGDEQTLTSRFPDGSQQTTTAVFARNEWFGSSGSVNAGLRYSRFAVDIARADRESGAELDLKQLTGNLGVSYYLSDRINLVANLGEGFRAPNIFDLATLGPRPGNRFNVANADLGPEQLRSVDLGLKWASAATEAEVFFYTARFDDKIDSVATGEVTPDGRIVVRSENLNRVNLRGLELGARRQLGHNDELWAVVNWTHGTERQVDGDESPADRVPPLNGELGWRRQMDADLRLEGYLRFARRQERLSDRDVRDPRINPDGTPGWATVNARVSWTPRAGWRVIGALENIFDKPYREHGSGIDAPGRNLKLSLSLEW